MLRVNHVLVAVLECSFIRGWWGVSEFKKVERNEVCKSEKWGEHAVNY